MKFFCFLISLLALSACNAFDENRLAARRSDAVQAPNDGDNGADDGNDAAIAPNANDASAGDDSNDSNDSNDPHVRNDASAIDDGDDLDEPSGFLCGDEDAGSEGNTDSDGDGIFDCEDRCPLDPGKDAPGLCGCGHADAVGDGIASCTELRSALAHRFKFSGTGTVLRDARGNASGTIVNAQLSESGDLALAGGTSDQYVDLPNDVIAGVTNLTIEAWVTWDGGGGWQRIFDFGDSDQEAEGDNGVGTRYLMLSPLVNDRSFGAAFANDGADSAIFVESAESLPIGSVQHVALVFDDDNDQMKIYLNGNLVGGAVVEGSLSQINFRNNWLGRSQFAYDAGFGGTLHELRIYNRALSAAEMALSDEYGTDPSFLGD